MKRKGVTCLRFKRIRYHLGAVQDTVEAASIIRSSLELSTLITGQQGSCRAAPCNKLDAIQRTGLFEPAVRCDALTCLLSSTAADLRSCVPCSYLPHRSQCC